MIASSSGDDEAATAEAPSPPAGGTDAVSMPSRRDDGIPVWVRFCDDLVAEAARDAGKGAPSGATPADELWERSERSGATTPSARAVGGAVVASYRLARHVRDGLAACASPVVARESDAAPALALPARVAPAPALPAPTMPPPPPPPAVALRAPAAPARPLPAPPALPPPPVLPAPPAGRPAPVPADIPVGAVPVPAVPVASPEPRPETPAAARRMRRLRRLFVALGWMRNLGLILLLFAAWQMWGTSIEQAHAQRSLRTQFLEHVQHETVIPAAPNLVAADAPDPAPKNGAVVGHLQVPAIGVDQYVVEGTDEGDLAEGPGHYVGTSMPGQAGNIGIAGHRTTYGAPFNQLDQLKVSDKIVLTTLSGEVLTYVVSQPPQVVSPSDVAVLNSFNDDRITLTTCNPKYSSTSRLVVVGLLSSPAPVSTTQVSVTPKRTTRVILDPVGWNLRYLPIVAGLLVLMVLLGVAHGRARELFSRVGRVLVLVPVWTGVLYFLFTELTKMLPANL